MEHWASSTEQTDLVRQSLAICDLLEMGTDFIKNVRQILHHK